MENREEPPFESVFDFYSSKLEKLTPRERSIMDLICNGGPTSTKDISSSLGVSHNTIRNHLERIYQRLGIHNKVQAAELYAFWKKRNETGK